jgi:hypothetical protein
MRGREVPDLTEPEGGEMREDLPLVGNGIAHDDIEGRDAIGRDDEQAIVQVEDVPDLAAADQRETGKLGLEQGASHIGLQGEIR